MAEIEVTQADRDAAAAIYNAYSKSGLPCEGAKLVASIRAEAKAGALVVKKARALIAVLENCSLFRLERGDDAKTGFNQLKIALKNFDGARGD